MDIKSNFKFGIDLSKRILKGSLALALTFSLLPFDLNTNKVRAHDQTLHERHIELEEQLKQKTKGTSEYTRIVKDLLDLTHEEINQENQKMVSLNESVAQTESEIVTTKEQITELSDKVKQAFEAVYVAGGDSVFLDLLFKSNGLKDFVDTADTVKAISDNYEDTLKELDNKKTELDQKQKELSVKKEEQEKVLKELDEQKKKDENIQKENADVLEKLRQEYMSANGNCVTDTQGSIFMGSVNTKNGRYCWPLPGFSMISSPFGDGRNHLGIDITGSGVYGAPIVAAADGEVMLSGSSGGGYGNYVEINHGGGYSTLYAHLSVLACRSGQQVKAGQVIGYVGNTGHSFGAHLHFETRYNNVPYNPQTEV